MSRPAYLALVIQAFLLSMLGCSKSEPRPEVIIYTSVDQPVADPILRDFEKETGIHVTLITDAEASKSVGLAERLRAERDHPQADVWWGNECFLTINLADDGVLAPYDSPAAADVPARFKDADHRWAGSALRVRVIAKSTAQPSSVDVQKIEDLANPNLKDKIAMARPTAGTTGGQVAALYVKWGDARANAFFHQLHDNHIALLGGNSVAAQAVADQQFLYGLCDNDDAASAKDAGGAIEAILPDQTGDGTLAMPCAIGLVAGARHADAAKKLIDYLLSPAVDRKLIDAKFAFCSARDTNLKAKFMDIDYHAVAKAMPSAIRAATSILEGR
jgi:iron(III) transport system substrate-binding protein